MMVEAPISLLTESPRFPDRDNLIIYDHLKYYLSLPPHPATPLPSRVPAVWVTLEEGMLLLTHNHKYLQIAREFAMPRMRAIITRPKNTPEPAFIAQLPTGVTFISKEALDLETSEHLVRGYHVYFFEHRLDKDAQSQFLGAIVGFFERLQIPLLEGTRERVFQWSFPFAAHCAQFEALLPLGDQSWFSSYLAVSREFSQKVARIVSFQGKMFPNLGA